MPAEVHPAQNKGMAPQDSCRLHIRPTSSTLPLRRHNLPRHPFGGRCGDSFPVCAVRLDYFADLLHRSHKLRAPEFVGYSSDVLPVSGMSGVLCLQKQVRFLCFLGFNSPDHYLVLCLHY